MIKRLIATVAILSSVAAAQFGQFGSKSGSGISKGTALPGSCAVGDLYYQTQTTIGLFECTATDTWTQNARSATAGGFDTLAGGTNLTAAMIVGTGSSLTATGSGIIDATKLGGVAAASFAQLASPTFTGTVGLPITNHSGLATFSGGVVATASTRTAPNASGLTASKPATCTVGDTYFATDATAGQNMFYCTATNTWTQQAVGAGSGTVSNSATSTNLARYAASGTTVSAGQTTEDVSGNLSVVGTIASGSAGTGVLTLTEGTPAGAAAGKAVLSPSSTSHQLQLSNNNGTFYPVTQTIASGTLALSTTAIGSATCTSAQTATATGTATTDAIIVSFNGDPTAVTGYVPLTTGMLTIIVYPTLNTFNAKVCNNTSASITPGAITLNWRVVR